MSSIGFQTFFFFLQALKIVLDSRKFSMLLLYILWDDLPIFMISYSNEQLKQEFEYILLKPDCHSWWISKMQSGREDTLEERYAIKFCFKLRLLRRGLEFHVCTINKSAHTKKYGNLLCAPCMYIYIYIYTYTQNYIWISTKFCIYSSASAGYGNISLSLSLSLSLCHHHHPSVTSIIPVRSSRWHPVPLQKWYVLVFVCQLILLLLCVGFHRRTSL